MIQLESKSTIERLDIALSKIKDPTFLLNKGRGNEVNYYIFDYPARDELTVREWIKFAKGKNQQSSDGFHIVEFDLYDIMIDTLEEKGFMEKCFEFEKKYGIDHIVNAIGRMLRLSEDSGGILMNYIKDNTPENAIVFLTGIGKCYPFIRSHKVLNNLHQIFDESPVILFFPGEYDGQELRLFGSMKDDNYYRAFRLV